MAHPQRSSDPSKGESGNPVPIRQVFETQLVTTNLGSGLLANIQSRDPVLRIKVESLDFGNENLGNAPPYYIPDEIQLVGGSLSLTDRLASFKAGNHFGKAEGEGVGSADDVAEDLALILNDPKTGLVAEVDPQNLNHVLVSTKGILDDLFIKVYSYSYLLLAGDPPFILEDFDGNVLYDPTLVEGGSYINILKSRGLSPMEIS